MKKIILTIVTLIFTASVVFAAGDKNHGSKGQGSTGSQGQGQTSQNRGG